MVRAAMKTSAHGRACTFSFCALVVAGRTGDGAAVRVVEGQYFSMMFETSPKGCTNMGCLPNTLCLLTSFVARYAIQCH